jgi:hypothetical protein
MRILIAEDEPIIRRPGREVGTQQRYSAMGS